MKCTWDLLDDGWWHPSCGGSPLKFYHGKPECMFVCPHCQKPVVRGRDVIVTLGARDEGDKA